MLAYSTHEDFRGQILDGLRRRYANVDFIRVVDVGMRGAADNTLMEWAAAQGRVIVSHDVDTMTDAADRRIAQGLTMTGLIIVPQWLSTRIAIDHLQFCRGELARRNGQRYALVAH